MLPDVMSRRYLVALHKRARAVGLDLNNYNLLKERQHELETTLKIIRGPLYHHKNKVEEKIRQRGRSSSSSSSSSSRSRSPSPKSDNNHCRSPSPEPKKN